jgi:hypothetical protein
MTEREHRPEERVTVTHPMTRAARYGRSQQPSAVDLRSNSENAIGSDELVLTTLMRSQLWLTLVGFATLVGLLALVVGGLAVLVKIKPSLIAFRVVDIPVAWWLLGALMFPLLLAIAIIYVRRIELLERRFSSLTKTDRSAT